MAEEKKKQYGTKLAKDRAKKAFKETRLKRIKKSDKKFSEKHPVMSKLTKGMDVLFGQHTDKGKLKSLGKNFEHIYKTYGKKHTDAWIKTPKKKKSDSSVKLAKKRKKT